MTSTSKNQKLGIKFWGVRGSLPTPHKPQELQSRMKNLLLSYSEWGRREGSTNVALDVDRFLSEQPVYDVGGYGGNTPCIEVSCGDTRLLIDAGSGLRGLGIELLKGPCGVGKGEVHLAFTHFHWDHLVGLPFFTPIFIPGNTIHIYAVQPDLEEIVRTVFKKPFFPLNFEQLGAEIVFHALEPRKPWKLGDLSITPYQLDHPDPCWGYQIEGAGKKFAYCVDTEATRFTHEELGPDLPMYQGLDLMIFDAQYTLQEAAEKVDWGHAAAAIGLDLAIREKIPRVLFMHHDPGSTDRRIDDARLQAAKYLKIQTKESKRQNIEMFVPSWSFVTEGTEILV